MANHPSTRDRLIDAAIELIDAHGEPALGLADIAAATGIQTPSIHYFFENREALVVAAHRERFRRSVDEVVGNWTRAVSAASTHDEFVAAVRWGIEATLDASRADTRTVRVQLIARALHTASLRDELIEASHHSNVAIASAIEAAQARGWVRTDIDPAVAALWVRGQAFSRLTLELDPERYDGDADDRIVVEATVGYLIVPE
jgi:AcrR family transcriptional regulator